jgi:NAD(P)-dependent dehydrogenase (short-subunit alcohol dehydrogenase family)
MSIAIADRDASGAQRLVQELVGSSGRIIAVGCDVSVYEEVAALAATAQEELGPVAVLCNNAGIGGGVGANVVDRPASDWDAVLGVNLQGVIHGVRAFVPAMVASGEPGHIVNTASMAAFFPSPGNGPYTTSKFAVAGLSEVLRAELAPHGIGVSVLCPGPFDTAIWGDDDASNRGKDPAALGPRVLAAIEGDEAFIFTHPEFAPMLSERFERIVDQLRAAGDAMREAESRLGEA